MLSLHDEIASTSLDPDLAVATSCLDPDLAVATSCLAGDYL